MDAGAPTPGAQRIGGPSALFGARRWRAFADAVAAALGLNVWISLVLLPGVFVGAFGSPWTGGAAAAAIPVLFFGIARRSETILLLGFPAALLLPVAFAPELVTVQVYGPIRFAVVAAGLLAYLLGASIFTSFREPPPPLGSRPLSSAARPTPPRWRRRFRIYRALTVLSAAFPLVLLYHVNFHEQSQLALHARYPGRVASVTALLNLAAIATWVLVFSRIFLGILKPHRTGDRDLQTDLALIGRQSRTGRPRTVFYVGVAAALLLMFALVLLRYH